ncbi:MAG: SAM hydroxide adenosyltransferase [Caulobacteraceae bacterium]
MIPILDIQYGNVWSNIDKATFEKLNAKIGDILNVEIRNNGTVVYSGKMKYVNTFGDVPEGENLLYLNEMFNVSLAVNMGSFSDKYKVYSGYEWSMKITK